ncbi:hypothetical protein Agabi119p4_5292 [Agaricus bisporus var. burnettii]|uniref:F-box domain-containing protein n=1 Tax=Agaricus bisporus var. burnettii TaxID=192524 RepID=A0A8H7KFY1_AGABI|nr:hypothetical protein Agabi119p4_5292 [Agaricus bisporus var. burnettii]
MSSHISPSYASDSNAATSSSQQSFANVPSQQYGSTEKFFQEGSLPLELIGLILDLCDYSTLLRLAQVNRFFNFYATEVLLIRGSVGWRSEEITISYDSPHKHQILAALNIRQADRRALASFSYSFDSERLSHQLDSVTRFLRNRVISIRCLTLCCYSSTLWTVNEELSFRSKLVILLEAALAKGCQHLHLSGGIHSVHCHTPICILPRCASRKSSRERFPRWFRRCFSQQMPPCPPAPPLISFPTPQIPSPSFLWENPLSFLNSTPSLTKLKIEPNLMLGPCLNSSTLGLLRNQSPTLRKLTLDATGSHNFSNEFFSTISLPVLESFTYKSGYVPSRMMKLWYTFLVRNPSIQKVKFPPMPANDAEYPDVDRYPYPGVDNMKSFLPNLKKLYGHPYTIYWFLRDPSAFPNLEHVSVEAGNDYVLIPDDVDMVLISLGSRMTDLSSSCNGPIHLKLKISADTYFCSWIQYHITNPSISPISRLRRVETLSLSTRDSDAKLEVRHLDDLRALYWSDAV